MPNNPILLPKACACGSQTGALGSSVGAGRFLCCAQCNKHVKAITKAELEALVSSGGEPVGVPLRRPCLCGNKKGVGVQAGSQWVVRCVRCNIFSHFANEAEVLRSGSSLTKPQTEVKKGTAPKAAKVMKLATPLPRDITPTPPKLVTAPVVALVTPVQNAPLTERGLLWEEEFVAEVEKELRMMALQRKIVELRNALTWPLRNWNRK